MTKPSPRMSRSLVFAGVVALAGIVIAAAATERRPGPRLSRKARLVDLIRAEDARARALRAELDALRAQVESLAAGGSARTKELDSLQRTLNALAPYAGLAPVRGPGLRVELRDSTLRTSPTGDPNDLVIHEEDLQAVVNALWAAGAEGIAINGERITGESAIRCVGNTLLLHGSVYSPPYRIAAVGNVAALRHSLDEDPFVQRFSFAVTEFRLGFEVTDHARVDLPAFGGTVGEKYAVVA